MIVRIWHGWTAPGDADAYETLLKDEVFVGIGARRIEGYRGIELLRRDSAEEVEFITIMRFDSIASVRMFAGAAYEVAVVPTAARAVAVRQPFATLRAERGALDALTHAIPAGLRRASTLAAPPVRHPARAAVTIKIHLHNKGRSNQWLRSSGLLWQSTPGRLTRSRTATWT